MREAAAIEPAPGTERLPVRSLAPGDRVGSYVVTELAGRGAMGEVYIAVDQPLERRVALKILRPNVDDEGAVRHLLREAQAMARFSHPNIVSIHAAGEHHGAFYVVMEYVDGPNLEDHAQARRLPLPEVVRIGRDVASALAEAHRFGVVHRDLKPANVMLDQDGRARIMDFGLAMVMAGQPATGEEARSEPSASPLSGVRRAIRESDAAPASCAMPTTHGGTPRYMAPEAWRCEAVGPATDLWALGTILYELTTGKPPFGSGNVNAIAQRIVSGTRPAPLADHLFVPRALDYLVSQCLEVDARLRPSAATVAAALGRLSEVPPEVLSTPPPAREARRLNEY